VSFNPSFHVQPAANKVSTSRRIRGGIGCKNSAMARSQAAHPPGLGHSIAC